MSGDGKAYPKQSKPHYYDALNAPYSGLLTSTIGARWVRMFLGGAITATTNTTPGTIDSLIEMKQPGLQPMCCNLIRSNGGAQFLFGDVFVQTIEISQQGSSEPRITVQRSNGGHHAELADTSIDTADVAAQPTYLRYDGKRTTFTFSDGVDNYNFVSEKRLIDVSFSGNQNVIVEQLIGDSPIDAANACEGGFTTNIYIDVQDAMIRAKVYMDDDFAQFASWKANRKVTSVSLKFETCEIVGAGGTHRAHIDIQIPIGEFNITPDTQGNFDAYSLEIKAIEGHASTGSLVRANVRQVGALDETAP
jgi:hypothetical protein